MGELECLQKDKLYIDVENACCGSIEMWRVVMLSTSTKVVIEALCGANSCRFLSESSAGPFTIRVLLSGQRT